MKYYYLTPKIIPENQNFNMKIYKIFNKTHKCNGLLTNVLQMTLEVIEPIADGKQSPIKFKY